MKTRVLTKPAWWTFVALLASSTLQPRAQAAAPPMAMVATASTQRVDVQTDLTDIGVLILDDRTNFGVVISNSGEPTVFRGDEVLGTISVTHTQDHVLVVVGQYDTDGQLCANMNIEFSHSVTGKMKIVTSSIDGTDGAIFHVSHNLETRAATVTGTVCKCVGGTNVPKRACVPAECTDPTECATGAQTSLAHCKEMDPHVVRQGGFTLRSDTGGLGTVEEISDTP